MQKNPITSGFTFLNQWLPDQTVVFRPVYVLSCICVQCRPMDNVEDIAKGNATVIKMVITFNRGARGQNSLKELVLPLVNRIISDKDLLINVNPVDIYKAWINQRESETGESCGLPYDVSTEQALSYPEVTPC